jgi:hypothetical protein
LNQEELYEQEHQHPEKENNQINNKDRTKRKNFMSRSKKSGKGKTS